MRKMEIGLKDNLKFNISFISTILAITNIFVVLLFLKWVKNTEVLIIEGQTSGRFDFAQLLTFQANQFSMIQIYVIVLTLVLGIISFFGYTQIKAGAAEVAEKTAKDMIENFLEDQKGVNLGNPDFPDPKNKEGYDK